VLWCVSSSDKRHLTQDCSCWRCLWLRKRSSGMCIAYMAGTGKCFVCASDRLARQHGRLPSFLLVPFPPFLLSPPLLPQAFAAAGEMDDRTPARHARGNLRGQSLRPQSTAVCAAKHAARSAPCLLRPTRAETEQIWIVCLSQLYFYARQRKVSKPNDHPQRPPHPVQGVVIDVDNKVARGCRSGFVTTAVSTQRAHHQHPRPPSSVVAIMISSGRPLLLPTATSLRFVHQSASTSSPAALAASSSLMSDHPTILALVGRLAVCYAI